MKSKIFQILSNEYLKILKPYPPTQESELVNSEGDWENHLKGTRQINSVT